MAILDLARWPFSFLLAGAACAGAAPVIEPEVEPPPPPPQLTIADAAWKTVLLSQFGLWLPLPEAASWRRLETDSWWAAKHGPTGSVLEVKRWNQRELVDTADCERQARLWRPDLEQLQRQETIVEDTTAEVAGYRARVIVLSRGSRGNAAALDNTLGAVLVFGANVRSCLSLRFRTRALGKGSPEIVAARMALVSEALLPKVRLREIDARVSSPHPAR